MRSLYYAFLIYNYHVKKEEVEEPGHGRYHIEYALAYDDELYVYMHNVSFFFTLCAKHNAFPIYMQERIVHVFFDLLQ